MSPTIDPSKLKVTELREELQARGLDTKGNKPVLVKRLKKALEEELNKELPDTSIADTSTEDFDCSRTEDANLKETEPDPEPELESESVVDQKDNDSSSQENVDEPVVSSEKVEVLDDDEKTNGEEETSKTELGENEQDTKDDQNKEEEADTDNKDVEMKETTTSTENDQKGEKRKRTEDSSENAKKKKVFKIIEDEPEIDSSQVLLSWFDSDLHLVVDKQSFLSAKPIHDGLFGYAWAGVRATHGVNSGKIYYEVKLTEELPWEDFTNQRRERQERAKEKREKEKQKQKSDAKKSEAKQKESNTEEKKSENDESQNEQMEVTENEQNVSEKIEDTNDDNKTATTDESKMDTNEEVSDASESKGEEIKENENKESSESTEEATTDPTATAEDDNKESSEAEATGEQPEIPNNEKKENSEESKIESALPILTHLFRVGWSVQNSSLQLGEDNFSYGYESTGKFVSNKEFKDFAASYKLGDVVGAYLDISDDNVEMRFTVNGELQPEVTSIPRSDLPQENLVFFPHILSRNYSFELNLGTKEEPWFPSPEGLEDYTFLQAVDEKVQGPVRPEKREECEVIMMCGLPGSGKTHWVDDYLKTNVDKLITVISATHLLEKMTVHGQPLKSTYNGQWIILMEKLQRCLTRLSDIASQRRRNYILDQTNVFPSAQHRKLRAFGGFKRRAVVVVVGDEEYAKRQSLKEAAVGKEVQVQNGMDMKANMALPTVGELFDEIIYTDLNEEEAKAKVTQYNTEGKAYINQKKKYRDDKGRFYNRSPYNRGGNYRDNRGPPRYDRGPRSWGQLPPPGRNPRDRRPPPMAGGRDWMRNDRGPQRPMIDRHPRDSRQMNYNRNRAQGGGGRPGNWQSGGNGYGQGGWGGQQGNWGYGNQGWGSNYQQQGNWGANGQDQWKYGGGNNQGYHQQGYNQEWNNYYGQYPQNWSGQGQQSVGGSNQYAQWAQYAQQYAQGQNAKYTNAASKK